MRDESMKDLLAELERRGVRLAVEHGQLRVHAPAATLDDALRAALRQHKGALIALLAGPAPEQPLQHDAAGRHEPFPLTALQRAYWLGRDRAIEMGGVATHLYLELACTDLDLQRLGDALNRLIERHDMLRAVLDGEGRQRVLAQVPPYRIAVTDCRGAGGDGVDGGDGAADAGDTVAEAAALATRELLSHQVLSPDAWPLFDIRATLMPRGALRLHLSLDLLIADGPSIQLLLAEWHALYHGQALPPAPAITFRDCVLDRLAAHDGPAATAARAYWAQRVPTLPPAPELPLRGDAAARRALPRFSRRSLQLAAPRWAALKQRAAQAGVSPSCLVLCAFAEVLARWSRSPHFTVALTTGLREGRHPDIARVLGDFTSVVLHEVDRSDAGPGLLDFAARQQQRLTRDLQHRAHDGIEVRREWARQRGMGAQAAMPVVFSSGLGWAGREGWNLQQFGRSVFSVSQTSQVWLDHHATELHGALVLAWDAVDAVFEPGVLDAMFESYRELIEALASGHPRPAAALPAAMQGRRDEANRTAWAGPVQPLHAALVQQALRTPSRTAVVAAGRSLDFGTWLAEAAAVADTLLAHGHAPGQPVAIVMRKGWQQAVAALGVLLARGAYVPIDADLPPQRRRALLQASGASQVLVQAPGSLADAHADLPVPVRVHVLQAGAAARYTDVHARSLEAAPHEAAYVIFTSGTTGTPKGVLIEHRGAANTVLAVNRLLAVDEGDAVLGVSSLGFDLSVYDLFGVPGAGGTLVLPDAALAHDPGHWAALLRAHRVTLWNSAPQLLRMLLDAQAHAGPLPGALRSVLLSGDFMPLDTLARLRAQGCAARLFSLGGATEASIWSVVHEVQAVDPRWASIPYGRPLPNQTAWVLDAALRPVPDHVRGRIFIGGAGLARGYLGDEQRTAERFITHPASGERLYDTGDLGSYDDGGNIIILGRDDGQVKIRGHRVELGEIEAALQRHPAVEQACAIATGTPVPPGTPGTPVPPGTPGTPVPPGTPGGTRSLAAFVQLRAGAAASPHALREHAAELLPDYMLPQRLVLLPRLPVSANGKVDRRALAQLPLDDAPAAMPQAPRTPSEVLVAAAWARVLPGVAIGLDDNFFDAGGDSVLATELLRELNAALPWPLQMHELFEHLTIEALARWVDARSGDAAAGGGRGLAALEVLAADVERLCAALDTASGHGGPAAWPAAPPRCVLLTGATGWVGAHLLAQLLRDTDAEVTCLARADSAAAARARVLAQLQRVAPGAPARWPARVRVLCGRLDAPAFDLAPDAWNDLCQRIDRIYHLAGSVSLAQDYAAHRRHNVLPLLELLHLAGSARTKPVFVLSPAAVCRRVRGGAVQVLPQARVQDDAAGLGSGYAQSKWVAEQILGAAARRGLPVRLYRTSHALPAAATGLVRAEAGHLIALRAAALAGSAPAPRAAVLHGLPVDVLCRRLLDDSLHAPAPPAAVLHLENPEPPALAHVLRLLRPADGDHADAEGHVDVDPRARWLQRCREAARQLPPAAAALGALLFEPHEGVAPVELMFGSQALEPTPADTRGCASPPPLGAADSPCNADYWQRVRRSWASDGDAEVSPPPSLASA